MQLQLKISSHTSSYSLQSASIWLQTVTHDIRRSFGFVSTSDHTLDTSTTRVLFLPDTRHMNANLRNSAPLSTTFRRSHIDSLRGYRFRHHTHRAQAYSSRLINRNLTLTRTANGFSFATFHSFAQITPSSRHFCRFFRHNPAHKAQISFRQTQFIVENVPANT